MADRAEHLLSHPLRILPLISLTLLDEVGLLARVVDDDDRLLVVDLGDVLLNCFKH